MLRLNIAIVGALLCMLFACTQSPYEKYKSCMGENGGRTNSAQGCCERQKIGADSTKCHAFINQLAQELADQMTR